MLGRYPILRELSVEIPRLSYTWMIVALKGTARILSWKFLARMILRVSMSISCIAPGFARLKRISRNFGLRNNSMIWSLTSAEGLNSGSGILKSANVSALD